MRYETSRNGRRIQFICSQFTISWWKTMNAYKHKMFSRYLCFCTFQVVLNNNYNVTTAKHVISPNSVCIFRYKITREKIHEFVGRCFSICQFLYTPVRDIFRGWNYCVDFFFHIDRHLCYKHTFSLNIKPPRNNSKHLAYTSENTKLTFSVN
jgi:hypothetical protein